MKINARFWAYHNGGPVKLTLRPGQTLNWSQGGPTEEGWWRESVTYTWDGPDWPGSLYRSWMHDGRDCDGYISHDGEDTCELEGLRAGTWPSLDGLDDPNTWAGVRWPDWQRVTCGVYDQEAVRAGY